jgi:hypothetical protein
MSRPHSSRPVARIHYLISDDQIAPHADLVIRNVSHGSWNRALGWTFQHVAVARWP